MNTFVSELKKEHDKFMKKQLRQAKARRTEKSPLRNEDFYYTDASKYAKKYYGETFYETTRFDNEWD